MSRVCLLENQQDPMFCVRARLILLPSSPLPPPSKCNRLWGLLSFSVHVIFKIAFNAPMCTHMFLHCIGQICSDSSCNMDCNTTSYHADSCVVGSDKNSSFMMTCLDDDIHWNQVCIFSIFFNFLPIFMSWSMLDSIQGYNVHCWRLDVSRCANLKRNFPSGFWSSQHFLFFFSSLFVSRRFQGVLQAGPKCVRFDSGMRIFYPNIMHVTKAFHHAQLCYSVSTKGPFSPNSGIWHCHCWVHRKNRFHSPIVCVFFLLSRRKFWRLKVGRRLKPDVCACSCACIQVRRIIRHVCAQDPML